MRRGLLIALVVSVGCLAAAPTAGAFVYFANEGGGNIVRANNDGTGVDAGFITGATNPCGVAVNSSRIYWGNQGMLSGTTVGSASIDGSGVNQSFVTGASSPCGVAVDDNFLYWANESGDTIGRAGLDGSSPNQGFVTGTSTPCGVAVSPTHIYWGVGDTTSTTIGRANLNGTSPDNAFIGGAAEPCGVAVNSAHVYWANFDVDNGGGTSIGRANLDASAVDQYFITGAVNPCGVAVTDTNIYWANLFNPGRIGRADLSGANPTQTFITQGTFIPCGVAVDELRRNTSAQVACSPSSTAVGQPSTCTATVTDTDSGPVSRPAGTVRFSSSSPGSSFSQAGSCTLGPAGVGKSSCAVSYTPGPSVNVVQALYLGDPNHDSDIEVAHVTASGFSLGAAAVNPQNGTATLVANLPGPGSVSLAGAGIVPVGQQVPAAGALTLPVNPSDQTLKALKRAGQTSVDLVATFTPTGGGSAGAAQTTITLVKQKPKKKHHKRHKKRKKHKRR
jgi:virginiamycin B lyase